jgi:hypothetical protein
MHVGDVISAAVLFVNDKNFVSFSLLKSPVKQTDRIISKYINEGRIPNELNHKNPLIYETGILDINFYFQDRIILDFIIIML